jgi:glutamyl-tRNA synthetase
MACPFGSLKEEANLKQLNDHLATKSWVADGKTATREDFDWCSQLGCVIDMNKFPHVMRWSKTVRGLKTAFPLRAWPRSGAFGSQAKGGPSDGKKEEGPRLEGLLKNAEMGKVCTRFPPEPSGYLHIGHAKAVMLNNHYARSYNGKLIVRFDDTNPSKEKMEFEESIIADLKTLKVYPDLVSHTSDYFDQLQKLMETVIKNGDAYCDDTDVDTMRSERDVGTESKCRSHSVQENLRRWQEMLKGSDEGKKNCVRGKMDMTCLNKCLRDPVFFRCKTEVAHHKHGFKYKAYPTYDFACPVVDSIEGVTHALRTIEYKDRDDMYKWVQDKTKQRKVDVVEFAKTQFSHTVLSKRKLAWFVDNGKVEGWSDPRFPTVQGILRRGLTVEALSEFVMKQGMSKATNLMEWDQIWAINKQKIDPVVPRYAAVTEASAVKFQLSGIDKIICAATAKHPKNPEIGERMTMRAPEVFIDQEDAQDITIGEELTLLHWGNVFADKIEKDAQGNVVKIIGRLNPEGSPKTTKKKIHWVANLPEHITPIILRELDHIVTKEKIEDGDQIEDIINPCSILDTTAIGDPALKGLQKGDAMQLERRGYYIVDSIAFPPGKPMVLIKIPDGKAKDMGMKSKVDPSKLQGGSGGKKTEGEKAKADKKADAAPAPEPKKAAEPKDKKADAKAKPKADGKEKAKAAPAPAEDDQPEFSKLDIRVGKVVDAWHHPEADRLFVEMIDVGDAEGPRQVVSGLREYYKLEEFKGRKLLAVCNLKPSKLVKVESSGMVLCAKDMSTGVNKVELIAVPDSLPVGTRLLPEGCPSTWEPFKPEAVRKKKVWENCVELLRTDENRVVKFDGKPLTAEGADKFFAPTLANAVIS